jgi:hypothetical protein
MLKVFFVEECKTNNCIHTDISIKVVAEQSGKVEYERKRLAEKFNEFFSDSQQAFALVFDFFAFN